MKNISLVVIALLGLNVFINAQTNVPEGTVTGVWTKANSPYLINGNIEVPDDSLFTIEAGTTIEFQGNYRLTVNGSIHAKGELGDSIYFYPKVNNTGWAGVMFYNNLDGDSGIFEHCHFRHVSWGALKDKQDNFILIGDKYIYNGAISVFSSKNVFINNCHFETNARSLASYGADELYVKNSFFTKHDGSIYTYEDVIAVIDSSYFVIENCKFNNNKHNYKIPHGLQIYRGFSNGKKSVVKNCEFKDNIQAPFSLGTNASVLVDSCNFINNSANQGGAFTINTQYSVVQNCVFDGNLANSWGACVYAVNDCYGSRFDNCLFKNSRKHSAIQCYEAYRSPLIINCKFIDNEPFVPAIGVGQFSDKCQVVNCLFEGNGAGIGIGSGSKHLIANCTFVGNVSTNPNGGGGIVITTNCKIYNSIFWGNRDTAGVKNQCLIGDKVDFYNCIIEGDSAGFKKGYNGTGTWSGAYENCFSLYPEFKDSSKGDWSLLNTCSKMSYAHNKGFTGSIPEVNYPFKHVLSYSQYDVAGNNRIVGDSVDIGAIEIHNPMDRLVINQQPHDTLVCQGIDAVMDVKVTGNNIQYNWQYNDGSSWNNIGSNTSILPIGNPTSSMNGRKYRVNLMGSCSRSLASYTSTLKVANNPVVFIGKDTVVCDKTPLTLIATGGKKYEWSNGVKLSNLIFTPEMDTTFHVEVTDTNGCKGRDTIIITQAGRPVVNLGNDKTIDDWEIFTLDAGSHATYLWNDNSTMQTLDVDGHVNGIGKHLYWVEVENIAGCEARDSIFITVDNITSILNENSLDLIIYPNPAQDKLSIALPEGLKDGLLSIFTMSGKLVLTQEVKETETIVNLESIETGTFLIKFSSKDTIYFGKVIKE